VAAELAGELKRRRRVGDHPRIEQVQPGVEVVRALEKKRPLFREKEGEACVDGKLDRIGLDLREIGVDRASEGDIRGHAPGAGDPELRVPVVFDLHRIREIRPLLGCGTCQGRYQLEVASAGRALETDHLLLLGEIAVGAALAGEETDVVALHPWVGADRVDPPDLWSVDILESELVERDSDLHLVPEVRQAPSRLPDRVPRDVVTVVDVVVDSVGLNPERVGHELVGAALVVKGIEDDSHPVVLPCVVAVAKTGADPTGFRVEGLKRHQHPVFIVRDEHDGSHGGLDVLTRLHLVLEFEGEGIVPRGLVDRAIDNNLRGRACNSVGIVRAA